MALFSQYLGMLALIAMAISQLIATRIAPVEWIFGGLDRAYVLHKWLGIGALVAILLHDTIDAEMTGLGRETLLVEVAETAGEIALYGFLILVVITVATFVPYHLWRWTHRLMGGCFIFGAFHFLFILKPFSVDDPLGLYVASFCVLGVAAFAWRLLPARMRPSRSYGVSDLETTGGALAITMTPKGRALRYRPGQFAFAGFGGSEPHPFTISKAPGDDGSIRMTVANLGDFTTRLSRSLSVGTGRSHRRPLRALRKTPLRKAGVLDRGRHRHHALRGLGAGHGTAGQPGAPRLLREKQGKCASSPGTGRTRGRAPKLHADSARFRGIGQSDG